MSTDSWCAISETGSIPVSRLWWSKMTSASRVGACAATQGGAR